MKQLHVACAIIERNGKVLAAQRSSTMSLPLKWEFPGGKIKDSEQPEECLKRELLEELGIEIAIEKPLSPITHQYSTFIITLYPFICKITIGEIKLHEHKAPLGSVVISFMSLIGPRQTCPCLKITKKYSLKGLIIRTQ